MAYTAIRGRVSVALCMVSACIVSLCMLTGAAGQAFAGPAAAQAFNDGRTVLRVALYPDIPGDLESMLRWVERHFEAENPDVDLELVAVPVMDMYEVSNIASWLTQPVSGGGMHLLEIDSLLLGAAVATGSVAQQTLVMPDWHPAAYATAHVDGRQYGVTHWLCGYFLMTPHRAAAEADSLQQMLEALQIVRPEPPYLGADYTSSWFISGYYLQSWMDNFGRDSVRVGVYAPVNEVPASAVGDVAHMCVSRGNNPCVDGTYADFSVMVADALQGRLAGLAGFSETMREVVAQGGDAADWYVTPFVLGPEKDMMLMSDVFVGRKNMTPDETDAAERFMRFMLEDSTYAGILFPQGAPPRYVIPARMDVLQEGPFAADVYYSRLRDAIRTAGHFPNQGVPENRERIFSGVLPYLRDDALPEDFPAKDVKRTSVPVHRKARWQRHKGHFVVDEPMLPLHP